MGAREQFVEIIRDYLHDDEIADMVAERLADELIAARVPCTTCDATHTVYRKAMDGQMWPDDCPDCTDGTGGPLILLAPRHIGWAESEPSMGGPRLRMTAWYGGTHRVRAPRPDRPEVPVYVVRPENEKP